MGLRYRAIISYADIVKRENMTLQRGMNYRVKPHYSIILMSVRKGAPYQDQWHEETGVLEYEGHDELKRAGLDPKTVDQPARFSGGTLTENGKFWQAADDHKAGKREPEIVQVYEKISQGIWSDRGRFALIDAKTIHDGQRNVFRFFLRPTKTPFAKEPFLSETRMIPTHVKVEVWKRDGGKCVKCGSTKNLHFDHDVPFSKGGSSITAANVRVLCARHNLEKSDKIMSLGPALVGLASFLAGRAG